MTDLTREDADKIILLLERYNNRIPAIGPMADPEERVAIKNSQAILRSPSPAVLTPTIPDPRESVSGSSTNQPLYNNSPAVPELQARVDRLTDCLNHAVTELSRAAFSENFDMQDCEDCLKKINNEFEAMGKTSDWHILNDCYDRLCAACGVDNGDEIDILPIVEKRLRSAVPGGWKPRPLNPTPAMKTDGGRRLLSFQDGSTDASFSPLQWAAVKNEAERVWRSMWLCAGETVLEIDEHGKVSEAVPEGCVVSREQLESFVKQAAAVSTNCQQYAAAYDGFPPGFKFDFDAAYKYNLERWGKLLSAAPPAAPPAGWVLQAHDRETLAAAEQVLIAKGEYELASAVNDIAARKLVPPGEKG